MATLVVALLYGVLSLDHFMVGPLLLSRPLPLATLVGVLCGHPAEGVTLGIMAESLWVSVPPAGALQWDVGLATALAGAWAFTETSTTHANSLPGWTVALAFVLAIPPAVLGRRVDLWIRRHMRPLADRALEGVQQGVIFPLRSGLMFAAVLWGFKSLVVFFVTEAIGGAVYQSLLPGVSGPWAEGLEWAWRIWPALGLAALLHHFSARLGKDRWAWTVRNGQ